VRTPTDKPRVERVVPFVRNSMFAGETFVGLDAWQRHAERWCATRAGLRIHGTTQCRPAEHFALEEQAHLLPMPTTVYDVPIYADAKVGPITGLRFRGSAQDLGELTNVG
jgi:hypothetical protein